MISPGTDTDELCGIRLSWRLIQFGPSPRSTWRLRGKPARVAGQRTAPSPCPTPSQPGHRPNPLRLAGSKSDVRKSRFQCQQQIHQSAQVYIPECSITAIIQEAFIEISHPPPPLCILETFRELQLPIWLSVASQPYNCYAFKKAGTARRFPLRSLLLLQQQRVQYFLGRIASSTYLRVLAAQRYARPYYGGARPWRDRSLPPHDRNKLNNRPRKTLGWQTPPSHSPPL